MTNLSELREKAEAATKGEWFMYGEPDVGMRATVFTGTLLGGMQPVWDSRDDEEYVLAAQPRVVIGMIDELEAKDRRIEALEKAARQIQPYLIWTIGEESPGHHPTMPSAVDAFLATLSGAQP